MAKYSCEENIEWCAQEDASVQSWFYFAQLSNQLMYSQFCKLNQGPEKIVETNFWFFFSVKWTQGVHKVIRAMSEKKTFFLQENVP